MANEQTIKLPRTALFFRDSVEGSKIEFANGAEGKKRFKMVVNSGADMFNFWWGKIALDLSGGRMAKKKIPALREHDRAQIVGWHDEAEFGNKVITSGYITESTPAGREVSALLEEGFPFQASARAIPIKIEQVAEGAVAEVNNRNFKGPGVIFRKWELDEGTFCIFGADDNTNAAAASENDEEEIDCEFIGEVPAQLTKGRVRDTERDQNMALFDKAKKSESEVTPAKEEQKETMFSQADLDLAQRASFAAGREEGVKAGREEGIKQGASDERQRILDIQKLALPGQEAIVNAAIAEGKTVEQAKGLFLEAARQEKASALDKLKGQSTPSASTVTNGAEQFTDSSSTDAKANEAKLRSEFGKDKDHDGLVKLSGGNEEEAFKKYCALRRAEEAGRIRGR